MIMIIVPITIDYEYTVPTYQTKHVNYNLFQFEHWIRFNVFSQTSSSSHARSSHDQIVHV